MAYAIGVAKPVSLMVNTYGTGAISDEKIAEIINTEFDLRPKGIVQMLDLLKPRYNKSASYGHFGRNDEIFTWERTNLVNSLRKYL